MGSNDSPPATANSRPIYLCLLDPLDYALKWGNYSANNPSSPDHQGTAS